MEGTTFPDTALPVIANHRTLPHLKSTRMKRFLPFIATIALTTSLQAQTAKELQMLDERLAAFAFATKVVQPTPTSCQVWLSSGDSLTLRSKTPDAAFASLSVKGGRIEGKLHNGSRIQIPRTPDQRGALIKLYKATGGKAWDRKNNWATRRPLYEWENLTCNDKGEVTRINLADNYLNGQLPDVFYAFPALRQLQLQSNSLTGTLPRSLAWLPTRCMIDVRYNQLQTTTLYVPLRRLGEVYRRIICYPQQEEYHNFRLFVDCDVDLNPTQGHRPDNHCRLYQKATEGAGINLFVIGEGYDRAEHAVGGTADYWLERSAEAIFEIEPYKKLRKLFNVFIIYAHSPERGVSLFADKRQSRYGYWQRKPINSSGASINHQEVYDTAKKSMLAEGYADSTKLMHFLMVVNCTNTGLHKGLMTQRRVKESDTLRLIKVALNPTCTGHNSLIWHEFGGHTFGALGDEYVPNPGAKQRLFTGKRSAIPANLDSESDPTRIRWAQFIADPRYAHEKIGVYKGGGSRRHNIYRATKTSIMRQGGNSKLRFNAPSRAAIYKKAMKLAYPDFKFDYETFVRFDLEPSK